MSNYQGCLGDYERLEPWVGQCDRCSDIHVVDSSYTAPRAECRHEAIGATVYARFCGGDIRFITTREEVVSAFRLGGEEAVYAILEVEMGSYLR